MFNTSLRRVAHARPSTPLGRSTPTTPHGQITATFTTRSHQRRHSSSKPPIPPNNGHPPIPAASVKQVGAPRSTDKRPGSESRLSKRNGKPAKDGKVEVTVKQKEQQKEDLISSEWTKTLPAVPSTQYLNPKDVYVASFFSTHRPISITGPLPPETSPQDIDKIFAIRPKHARQTRDVIYTISSAVQNLEGKMSEQPEQQEQLSQTEQVTQRADIIKALTHHNNHSATNQSQNDSNIHHLDSQPQTQSSRNITVGGNNVKLVIQALARQFRPFNPPPPPTAAPEVEFYPSEESTQSQQQQQTQSSEDLITSTLESNQASSSTQLESETTTTTSTTQDPQPLQSTATTTASPQPTFFTPSFRNPQTTLRKFRGMLLAQDLSVRDRLRKGLFFREMLLISVRRQRKLKMKKHKYKKLQRRTRNLRRRQGKI